jgi:hypothetical protein
MGDKQQEGLIRQELNRPESDELFHVCLDWGVEYKQPDCRVKQTWDMLRTMGAPEAIF